MSEEKITMWMQRVIDAEKEMSNEDLLYEVISQAQGDDTEGSFTKKGFWEFEYLKDKLYSRLFDWLTGKDKDKDLLISSLLEIVKANEWQTRHAAENRYCPYCCNESDDFTDQREHHAGCKFVSLVELSERLLS